MFSKQIRSRRGTTAVEYALTLGLIVVACLSSLQVLGQSTERTLFQVANSLMSSEQADVGPGQGEASPPSDRGKK